VEPKRIRNGLKNPFLTSVLSALLTDTQRRDNEDLLSYRLRESWGKSTSAALDVVFNQIESASWVLSFDDQTKRTRLSFNVEAVKGTDLDRCIDLQRDATATGVRWLSPDQRGFLSVSLVLPETFRTMLPLVAEALGDALTAELQVSGASAGELERMAQSLSNSPTFDLLLQWLPGKDGTHCFAATIPFPEPLDITTSTIELISAVDTGWQMAVTDIDGWPIHRFPGSLPTAEAAGLTDTWIAATDQQITLMQGSPDSSVVLSKLVRRDYEEPPDPTLWRRNGIGCRLPLLELFRLLRTDGDIDDDLKAILPAGFDPASPEIHDDVTALLHTSPQHLSLEITFDSDISLLAVSVFHEIFETVTSSLDL
ncbi:MAG: hypothetical protein KDA96_23905, partial [Planctomycetaceae bacterium]|nr:hypothetical protein [Planctomycetaceae bacterium]